MYHNSIRRALDTPESSVFTHLQKSTLDKNSHPTTNNHQTKPFAYPFL